MHISVRYLLICLCCELDQILSEIYREIYHQTMNVLRAEQHRRNHRDMSLRQRRTGLDAGDRLKLNALRVDIEFYDLITTTATNRGVANNFLALRTIAEMDEARILRQNLCVPDLVILYDN